MDNSTESTGVIRSGKRNSQRGHCWFCENKAQPSYKDVEIIRSFLTPRGKILARRITGVCARHQRVLSAAIKIARELALIR